MTFTEESKAIARRVGRAIDASPGPTQAVLTVAERLDALGFGELDESADWSDAVPERWYVRRGGALVAGVRATDPSAGHRIVGAHTDSPTLSVKPRPDTGRAGFRQLGVEVYGGALLNSWLDRDLGLSGAVHVRDDEGTRSVPVVVGEPVLRVPQLAIHLDGDIRERGLQLDRQRHLAPVWGLGEPTEGDLRTWLAERIDVEAQDVLSWDLVVHDITPATLAGRDEEFLVSGRLDDLCSVFCAVEALEARLTDDERLEHHAVLCFFDHEEVGSVSATGAGGELLPGLLRRIADAHGHGDDHVRSMPRSLCVSADMAHATHPNYEDRHEPDHPVRMNEGPVVKTNANQRYATDGAGTAAIIEICDRADIPHQRFVGRSDLPCGSTIGPVTAARMGVTTVDVGIAQLAMHSSRETTGTDDVAHFTRLLEAFF